MDSTHRPAQITSYELERRLARSDRDIELYGKLLKRQLALMDEQPLRPDQLCISLDRGLFIAIGWHADASSQLVTTGFRDTEHSVGARRAVEHAILESLCKRASQVGLGGFVWWDITRVSQGLRVMIHLGHDVEPGEVEALSQRVAAQAAAALERWFSQHPALERELIARVLAPRTKT